MSEPDAPGSKRRRISEDDADTPLQRLDDALNSITPMCGPLNTVLATLAEKPTLWESTVGARLTQLKDYPDHYLPPRFARFNTSEGPIIVFDDKYKLSKEKTARLTCAIDASSSAAHGYLYDSTGRALVLPRSYRDATKTHFDSSSVINADSKEITPLFSFLSNYLTDVNLTAVATLGLLISLRSPIKSKKTAELLANLRSLKGGEGTLEELLNGTTHDSAHFAHVCTALLGIALSARELPAIIKSLVDSKLKDPKSFFRIISTAGLGLPLTSFTAGQGVDSKGQQLERVKLCDLEPLDPVITAVKASSYSDFIALKKDSLVFKLPSRGVWRKSGNRVKGKSGVVKMKMETVEARTLQNLSTWLQDQSSLEMPVPEAAAPLVSKELEAMVTL